jgi:hypothetical protein
MASNIATILSPSTMDADAWDDLLSFIEERRVIPIVGPELLQIRTDKGPRLLHDWAAEKLAARLNVDSRELPQPYTLNDVVCWFLAARGRREEAYVRLRARHALALLRPAAKAASAPASVSLAYADALIRQGWEQNATAPAQAIKSFEEAKQVTVALGALTLANVFAATDHADADGFSSAALTSLGRLDEGTSAARSGAELARRVLVQRPGNRQALHAQEMSLSYLMAIPVSRLDPETAVQLGPQVLEASRVQLGLDPDNTVAISNQGVAYEDLAVADWRAGQLREGALVYRIGRRLRGSAHSCQHEWRRQPGRGVGVDRRGPGAAGRPAGAAGAGRGRRPIPGPASPQQRCRR